mmetsp:Transcript_1555/g.2844  ORF Transcript_1555/g.2844 Transcript_1555/m.2844 type:complete len:159 (-) Transcript_1555:217-693(-)
MELTDGDGSDEDFDGEEEEDDEEEEEEEAQDEANECSEATGQPGEATGRPGLNLLGNFSLSDDKEIVRDIEAIASGQEKTTASAVVAQKTVRRASSFSTPAVKKRRGNGKNVETKEEDSFDNMMKFMMMQRQMEIDAENRRRDREDKLCEDRREAEER